MGHRYIAWFAGFKWRFCLSHRIVSHYCISITCTFVCVCVCWDECSFQWIQKLIYIVTKWFRTWSSQWYNLICKRIECCHLAMACALQINSDVYRNVTQYTHQMERIIRYFWRFCTVVINTSQANTHLPFFWIQSPAKWLQVTFFSFSLSLVIFFL